MIHTLIQQRQFNESDHISGETEQASPWQTHRLYLHCVIDPRLLTAEGTEEVRQEKIKKVENIRQRLVEKGFESTLNGTPRLRPPTQKLLDGEQETRIIAMRLGPPPKGFANWSLLLLSRKVVALGMADTVSHETLRRTLKKMG